MPTITDWITAGASAVSALAIILVWCQTRYVAKQIKLQIQQTDYLAHQIKLQTQEIEASRRENAINQLARFTERLQQGTSVARRLVEMLNQDQTVKLFNEEPFVVKANEKERNWICVCLAEAGIELDPKAVQGDNVSLSQPVVSAIRWKAMTYLNWLEGVMAAWLHKVADREMIKQQFGYLIDETRGHAALERLREVAGGRNYPSISKFVEEIQREQRIKKGQDPIDKP